MKPLSRIHKDWKPLIRHLIKDERFSRLQKKIRKTEFFPKKSVDIFNALSFSPKDIKAVIIGLSPDSNASNGLAFGSNRGLTGSLKIIQDALAYQYSDITVDSSTFDNSLEQWKEQGVLLLNAALTSPVIGDKESHCIYWKWFINGVLKSIADRKIPTAIIGYKARELTIGHNNIINVCHPMKTHYEYYKRYCMYTKVPYADNFVYQKMFLWFDHKQSGVKWL